MIEHLDLFAALAAPFEHAEVRVRSQGGRQLQYITARTVMNRLDDVLGPANWWDEYVPLENSVICRLTIRLPDGTTLCKSDAGGAAGMPDPGDDEKSTFSDAFKRAAIKFGVGRYLYGDGVPRFIQDRFPDSALAVEPARPSSPSSPPAQAASGEVGRAGRPPHVASGEWRDKGIAPPKTGKALFAWIKEQDKRLGRGLLKAISDWAKDQDFPARMVQWNSEQVDRAFAEANARLSAPPSAETDPRPDPREVSPRS